MRITTCVIVIPDNRTRIIDALGMGFYSTRVSQRTFRPVVGTTKLWGPTDAYILSVDHSRCRTILLRICASGLLLR